MSDVLTPQKHLSLMIDDANEHELITKVARALSVKERVMILKDILTCSKNIPTIAKELNIPESSVTRHVDVLADAGLIYISYLPGIKGHVKYLSQAILDISVSLQPLQKERIFLPFPHRSGMHLVRFRLYYLPLSRKKH